MISLLNAPSGEQQPTTQDEHWATVLGQLLSDMWRARLSCQLDAETLEETDEDEG